MNPEDLEKEIEAPGLNTPRLTPADIDAVIVDKAFYTFPGTTMTICLITLKNGFTTVGKAACASLENFNQETGNKIAYDNARDKIWELEGYLLKQKLSEQ